MHPMNHSEIAADKLVRAYLSGRQLPKILHHAVVWIAQTRLSSGKLPVLDTALRANIDREASAAAPSAHVRRQAGTRETEMPMRLLSRLCCAQLPLKLDDQQEIQMCDVLRNAGLIEAELPPVLHERGRTVYAGQAIVMRVTPLGQSTSAENAEAAAFPSAPHTFPR